MEKIQKRKTISKKKRSPRVTSPRRLKKKLLYQEMFARNREAIEQKKNQMLSTRVKKKRKKKEKEKKLSPGLQRSHSAVHVSHLFCFCFGLVSRRRRRGSVSTMTPHQYWNVYHLKKSTHTFEDAVKSLLPTMANSHSKSGPASFRLSELQTPNTEARLKRRETLIPKKGTRCSHKTNFRRKDTNRPAQITKTCHPSFPLPHHNPLLGSRSPSTVREGVSCSDSRPLGRTTQQRGLVHFLTAKELALRPILPLAHFHSTDDVRKHTPSSGSKQGHMPFQIGFSHKLYL